MKKLIKAAAIILVIGVVVTPSEYTGEIVKYVVLGLAVCLLIQYLCDRLEKKRKDNKFREYREHMIRANREAGEQMAKLFDAPISKTVNYAHERYVFISEPKSLIMVDGVTFGFEQLLSCEFYDDSKVISNTTTRSEKEKPSRLRYMLNFDVNRIVSAVNAPTTSYSCTSSVTSHDYKLKLTLNSLTNPYILIRLGDDDEAKNYLKGIFDVIIHMNQENKAKERGH